MTPTAGEDGRAPVGRRRSAVDFATWWRFIRGGLMGTAISNYCTGYLITAGSDARFPLAFWIGAGAVGLLYAFGMGLNDYCDRHRDLRLHPHRPLPSGRLRARQAASFLMFVAIAALAGGVGIGWTPALALAHVMAWILAYNTGAKAHGFAGPIAMGAVRASVLLFGVGVARTSLGDASTELSSSPTVALFLLGGYVALVTWLSMAEDEPGLAPSRRRYAVLFACVALAGLGVAARSVRAGSHIFEAAGGWLPMVLWTALVTRGPLFSSPARPPRATYHSLVALFFLDLAILVSYDRPFAAWVPLALGALPVARVISSRGATRT